MSLIANRLLKIKPSPTLALSAQANMLKKRGVDVLNLTLGEPDFDTPDNIKQAAFKAMEKGHTKYTAVDGISELKQAICNKFRQENHLDYTSSQITVGTGGKQVIFNCMLATINEGDEVIIPAPFWVSYVDIVALCGGVPVIVQCDASRHFKLTPELLEQSITAKTKWLILNSPSNPTGAAYSKQELTNLAAVLEQYPQVNIFSDDIYEHLLYDGEFCNIAQISPEMKERSFVMNGVSKAYAMTGWRIGYGAGNPELIKAMCTLQSQSTSNPCSISQYAAIEALTGPQEFIATNNTIFKQRRDLGLAMLNDIPGISCRKPEGAFYLFADCQYYFGKKNGIFTIKNDSDFCAYMLEEAKVAIVPGNAFGLEGFFRISYATSNQTIQQAIERIAKACANLS